MVRCLSGGVNFLYARNRGRSNVSLVLCDVFEITGLEIGPISVSNLALELVSKVVGPLAERLGLDAAPMVLFTEEGTCGAADALPLHTGLVEVKEIEFEVLGTEVGKSELESLLRLLTGDLLGTLKQQILRYLASRVAGVLAAQFLEYSVAETGPPDTHVVSVTGEPDDDDFIKGVVTAQHPGVTAVQAKLDLTEHCLGRASDVMWVFVAPRLERVEIRNEDGLYEEPLDVDGVCVRTPKVVGMFDVLSQGSQLEFDLGLGPAASAVEKAKQIIGPLHEIDLTYPKNATLTEGLYREGALYARAHTSLAVDEGTLRVTLSDMRVQLPLDVWPLKRGVEWMVVDPSVAEHTGEMLRGHEDGSTHLNAEVCLPLFGEAVDRYLGEGNGNAVQVDGCGEDDDDDDDVGPGGDIPILEALPPSGLEDVTFVGLAHPDVSVDSVLAAVHTPRHDDHTTGLRALPGESGTFACTPVPLSGVVGQVRVHPSGRRIFALTKVGLDVLAVDPLGGTPAPEAGCVLDDAVVHKIATVPGLPFHRQRLLMSPDGGLLFAMGTDHLQAITTVPATVDGQHRAAYRSVARLDASVASDYDEVLMDAAVSPDGRRLYAVTSSHPDHYRRECTLRFGEICAGSDVEAAHLLVFDIEPTAAGSFGLATPRTFQRIGVVPLPRELSLPAGPALPPKWPFEAQVDRYYFHLPWYHTEQSSGRAYFDTVSSIDVSPDGRFLYLASYGLTGAPSSKHVWHQDLNSSGGVSVIDAVALDRRIAAAFPPAPPVPMDCPAPTPTPTPSLTPTPTSSPVASVPPTPTPEAPAAPPTPDPAPPCVPADSLAPDLDTRSPAIISAVDVVVDTIAREVPGTLQRERRQLLITRDVYFDEVSFATTLLLGSVFGLNLPGFVAGLLSQIVIMSIIAMLPGAFHTRYLEAMNRVSGIETVRLSPDGRALYYAARATDNFGVVAGDFAAVRPDADGPLNLAGNDPDLTGEDKTHRRSELTSHADYWHRWYAIHIIGLMARLLGGYVVIEPVPYTYNGYLRRAIEDQPHYLRRFFESLPWFQPCVLGPGDCDDWPPNVYRDWHPERFREVDVEARSSFEHGALWRNHTEAANDAVEQFETRRWRQLSFGENRIGYSYDGHFVLMGRWGPWGSSRGWRLRVAERGSFEGPHGIGAFGRGNCPPLVQDGAPVPENLRFMDLRYTADNGIDLGAPVPFCPAYHPADEVVVDGHGLVVTAPDVLAEEHLAPVIKPLGAECVNCEPIPAHQPYRTHQVGGIAALPHPDIDGDGLDSLVESYNSHYRLLAAPVFPPAPGPPTGLVPGAREPLDGAGPLVLDLPPPFRRSGLGHPSVVASLDLDPLVPTASAMSSPGAGLWLPTAGVGYLHTYAGDVVGTDNFATRRLVATLVRVGHRWARRFPEGPRFVVDDLSRPGFGPFIRSGPVSGPGQSIDDFLPPRHTTHRQGTEATLFYLRRAPCDGCAGQHLLSLGEAVPFDVHLDEPAALHTANLALVRHLVADPAVWRIDLNEQLVALVAAQAGIADPDPQVVFADAGLDPPATTTAARRKIRLHEGALFARFMNVAVVPE